MLTNLYQLILFLCAIWGGYGIVVTDSIEIMTKIACGVTLVVVAAFAFDAIERLQRREVERKREQERQADNFYIQQYNSVPYMFRRFASVYNHGPGTKWLNEMASGKPELKQALEVIGKMCSMNYEDNEKFE